MLTQRTVLGHIEIMPDGVIFVKELKQILENDVVIVSRPHRYSVNPTQDVSGNPYQQVRDAAAALWSQSVITAYQEKLDLLNQNSPGGN